ncbi:NADH dehydrogenase 1 beta subcomplex subunit 3 [Cantharellus anzutake]|uniref:NADH dehydrogenase 1 beta subcomplex subunit 3 n=1 Tax=Cantharellus anzutake TaxID=1750568 RepID=UPI001907302C|nr:NADH dehydrogenase 1 beta subcomplex subunit 3 [Cantharellus anzutake]KAF8342259.1 NADH dehydrogenase 1 beta subcomplex subunit 3 [Cantharellus anzutake]
MADGPLYRDPWARREAWRKLPIFSNTARIRNLFPGFGIALVAFGTYLVADQFMLKSSSHEHKSSHH